MYQYSYYRAQSLADACRALAEDPAGTAILAGGTDLMVQIHEKDKRWKDLKTVIDLSAVEGLDGITFEDGLVRVGAMVTHTKAEQSAILKEHAPILADACRSVGSPQIRNKGTLGGAIGNASPASDPMPALIALNADVEIAGPEGVRTMPLIELIEKPGKTALKAGEIIKAFVFPSIAEKKAVFIKLGRRKALSISRMNVSAVAAQDESGKIGSIVLVPGCVFATPAHAEKAEQLLAGKVPDAALIEEAAKAVAAEMIEKTGVRWSTEYKEPVITVLVRRALEAVLEVR